MKNKLVGIFVCMLLILTVLPVSGTILVRKTSNSLFDGKTLYVGGSGPNNYTKIQDAIDNASDGDTVFVYNGTYYENLVINNSITLQGENKNTTIVDGSKEGYVININADEVTISGFTLQNATIGIYSTTNRNNIIDNRILNQYHHGIYFTANHVDHLAATNNRIEKNYIKNIRLNGIDIFVYEAYVSGSGSYNIIKGNILIENDCGISIGVSCSHNIIYGNIILSNKDAGIALDLFLHNMNRVMKNHIEQNGIGIRAYGPSFNIIRNNNIIDNTVNATFSTFIFRLFNLWIGNYWGRPYFAPKPIIGIREFLPPDPWSETLTSPCVAFDIRPALKPYDI